MIGGLPQSLHPMRAAIEQTMRVQVLEWRPCILSGGMMLSSWVYRVGHNVTVPSLNPSVGYFG